MSSTRTPLTRNPLAVFTDARRLTDKEMQLWREMAVIGRLKYEAEGKRKN